jgi:hypothetical protein
MAAAFLSRPAERYSRDSLHDLGTPPSRFTTTFNQIDPFEGLERKGLSSAGGSVDALAEELARSKSRKSKPKKEKKRDESDDEKDNKKEELRELKFVHGKEVGALQAAITKLQKDLADKDAECVFDATLN